MYIYYICNHIITAEDHWESNHHIYISLVDTNFAFVLSRWFRGHGGGTAGVWVTTNPSLEIETWMKMYVYHTRVGMSLPPPEKLTARISQGMHVWIFSKDTFGPFPPRSDMDSLTGRGTFSLTCSGGSRWAVCSEPQIFTTFGERKKDADGQSKVHRCTPQQKLYVYIYIYSIEEVVFMSACFLCFHLLKLPNWLQYHPPFFGTTGRSVDQVWNLKRF